jgi:hypothetical protein
MSEEATPLATPLKVELQGNLTTTTAPPNTVSLSLQQTVCKAAELGWGIAELLGRCYALKEPPPPIPDRTTGKLITFQENYTPREKIRALIVYIRYLADLLDLSSIKIDHEGDSANGTPYIDVLEEKVDKFIQHDLPASGETREQLRAQINERLFFWDLNIHDVYQSRPTVVHKSYLVGRSLSSLRWYIGLQDKMPDNDFMQKICGGYVPLMQPYISTFASGALTNSLEPWWKAISGNLVKPGPDGEAPEKLKQQADIWYSLVTNERDALSYAHPTTQDRRRYLFRVLQQAYLPYILIGSLLLLLLVILLIVVISQFNTPIVKEISAVVGLIVAFAFSHNLLNNVGNILEKAVSDVSATIKGSVIENIRHTIQQEEVNVGTLIPPAQG